MGERLGRYMVLKHLASGGMADVLLARTDGIEGFERHVVLKRIRAEHAKDQRFIDMFLDEARLAANLHHQNIVQVHDSGESGGEYFFAMEYLHGEDLRAMLSVVSKTRAHMPLGTVVAIISSVAAGLHYAHERRGPDKKPLNIVHRDVSPSNILVSYDGSVKIVDFGIAKAAMRQAETRSGSLKGKVSYMSPEQCKSGTVDRRSDVYALGVVLYELATTTRLFKSDSDYLTMDAICTGKVPLPRVRRPDLPNELSTIIMTALAVDPDRRYQTADELRVALDAFATTAGLTTSASTIGAYVQKLCGEKPEPWLATAAVDEKPTGDPDTVVDSAERRTPAPTRTSTKLGWEKSLPTAPGRGLRPTKIAMFAIPLLAIAGLIAWRLAGSSEPQAASATVGAGGGAATAGTVTQQPTPTELPVASIVTPTTEATPIAATPEPKSAQPKVAAAKPAKPLEPKSAAKPVEPKSTPTITAPPAPAPPAAPAPEPKVVAPPAPEPKVTPPVTPPVAPPAIEMLPAGVVEKLASKNRKALLACEGSETLSGELTVRFQVDADGRVSKSSMHTTLGKPAVAICIQNVVKTWRFAKPATGAASGVYSISFQ